MLYEGEGVNKDREKGRDMLMRAQKVKNKRACDYI